MKRDNWTLSNGIKAGDDAWLIENDNKILCHVVKVTGLKVKGYEKGNVLIEIDGTRKAVLGIQLEPLEN